MAGKPIPFHELPAHYLRPGDEARLQHAKEEFEMQCRTCNHEFHDKRPRCPACGWVPPTPRREERPRREGRLATLGELSAGRCVFCRRRGAKDTCEVCGKELHASCKALHLRVLCVREEAAP